MQPPEDPALPEQPALPPSSPASTPSDSQEEDPGASLVPSPHRGHYAIPFDIHEDTDQGKHHPKTIVEMRMCAMSHAIREKPRWWEKIKDTEIMARWRKEALEQQVPSPRHRKLTDVMIDYVLDELHGYAALRDEETGIEVGPFEQIWKSDSLIPENLRERLKAAVAPLENVPDSEKDWHPGSNGQVLDLVHPSLYPIVYNRTQVRSKDATFSFISKQFQWLPSDFTVSDRGKVSLFSPYINNIHPAYHADLYTVIPEVLERALPMFEQVLSDLRRPLLPMRIETTKVGYYPPERFESALCLWDDWPPWPEEEQSNSPDFNETEWYRAQGPRIPEGRPYNGGLEMVQKTVSLNGQTIQCIVKLANIVLTPENPEYPGGKWHVEGMLNERIVASFIYYYDSENITESKLAFRRATSEPWAHWQDDGFCMQTLYDMDRYSPCVQEIGDVITKADRCIAFPNLYQHQVQPFQLADLRKPGHRKILVFFLVDPTYRIPSATDVVPQQKEWLIDLTHQSSLGTYFAKLPVELLDLIVDEYGDTMTRKEAEAYRKELMGERSVAVEQSNSSYFEVVSPPFVVWTQLTRL
ncbi:hypothetical protein BDM02DRAFT_3150579 [Thelephora ganbajun]|uniref:Uncharacterized protein n=1 Tax=Thelephora ganbajun TaxID=370292 RepID=A0ACB6Z4H1_THEGA|nr:hypothetical protein BDM02DRAFT_3150579 [Thelephora ganbajun]